MKILKVPNDTFECVLVLLSLNVDIVKIHHVVSLLLKRNIKRLPLAGVKGMSM